MLNQYAHLPLLISAGLTTIVFAFLIVVKARKTAKVSFVFFLSLLSVISGLVITYLLKDPVFLYLMLTLASLLMTPYAILKALQKKEDRTKKGSSANNNTLIQQRMNIVYEDQDISLLDVNRQFINIMAESFNNPQGLTPLLDSYGKKIMELTHADGVPVSYTHLTLPTKA